MEPGARKAARDAELRPLMEDFGGMGAGQLPLASPKLALHRALQYAVEFWPYVMNVLEDGHLELSNNVAEQAQRIFVVGRKNWLYFVKSVFRVGAGAVLLDSSLIPSPPIMPQDRARVDDP